jgi:predicted Zn-dependent protease
MRRMQEDRRAFRLGWGSFLLLVLLAGCADSPAPYQIGLKDKDLGPPILAPAEKQSPTPSAMAEGGVPEPLAEFRLENLKPAERPDMSSDEAGIWFQLDQEELKIRTSANRITDPNLNAYLKDIVCRLAGPYCGDIRVYLFRVPAFNASMAANGIMTIYSGFLLRVRNEAELSAVLGHEIGHFLRRHGIQRNRDRIAKENMLMFIRLALAFSGAPSAAGDLAMLTTIGSIQAYSRANEREADGYGLRFLFTNGYDVGAPAEVWGRMIDERERAGDDRKLNPFFATHPADKERQAELSKLADLIRPQLPSARKGREAFLKAILPLRNSFIEDEIRILPKAQALALLDILLEDGVRMGELYFYKGEALRRGGEQEDAEEAMKFYKKALDYGGYPAALHKSMALVNLRLERPEAARENFQAYLKESPAAADAALVRAQIEAMK